MTNFRRLFALALVAAFAGCTPSEQCSMGRITELPLDLEHGHLVTSVEIDGSPARLMIDTGSFGTLLTREGVARLHLQKPDWIFGAEVRGNGGSRSLGVLDTARFKLGAMHGEDLRFGVIDGTRVLGDLSVDGILGMDLLSQLDLDIDWPDHKLILYRPVKGCGRPSAALTPPLYVVPMLHPRQDRRPVVQVSIGGKRLLALLDSGSPDNLMYRRTARRIGLGKADLERDATGMIGGIGPRAVQVRRHVIAPVTVGDITIMHMPTGIIDEPSDDPEDLTLGLNFFARVHLWLSFSSQTVIMQFPPQPSP